MGMMGMGEMGMNAMGMGVNQAHCLARLRSLARTSL